MTKERVKFVLEWERRWNDGEGRVNVAELCREFGISRDRGYVWIERYRAARHDITAVRELSRRPHVSPHKISDEIEDVIVAARKAYPRWGPRKLHALLVERLPKYAFPSASTIAEVLRRRGCVPAHQPRERRRARRFSEPFAASTGPNATWCVDFKGQFRTGDGRWCYPLTILDAHSRFLIRCEALHEPNGKHVQRIFDSAFQEFGLPSALRSDNGSPFASSGAGGLTRLSVWWLRLGIRLERIQPGKPQQNGRLERLHRTLKRETASPPHANLRAQQRVFDFFRRQYNDERPHEALGQRTPSSIYRPSSTSYPRPLLRFHDMVDEPWTYCLRVDKNGFVRWENRDVFVSSALAHEDVELRYDGNDAYEVVFGPVSLGWLTSQHTERGLLSVMKEKRKVSGMSSD